MRCAGSTTATSFQAIVRLQHLYAAGEDPSRSASVSLDLGTLFNAALVVADVQETTLSANQDVQDLQRAVWRTVDGVRACVGLSVVVVPVFIRGAGCSLG